MPTRSLLTPDHAPCLHRKIFFCTFADVEEYPDLLTPYARGMRAKVKFAEFSVMAKSKQVVHAPISEAA